MFPPHTPAHSFPPHKRKSSPSSRFYRIRLVVSIFFLATVFICLFFLIRQFRSRLWTGEGRLTLIVVEANQIGLLSYDPHWGKAVWIPFPPDLQVTTLAFGKYPLASLWKLGEQEKIGGGKFLTQSLQWELGLGIDGYLRASSSQIVFWDPHPPQKFFSRYHHLLNFVFNTPKSSLTFWDTLHLVWHLAHLRQDKIITVNPETAGLSQRGLQADGQETLQINSDLFHSRLSTYFIDSQIESSPLPVAIINRTHTPGLAAKAALIVQSAGGQITRITTDSPTTQTGCILSVSLPSQASPQVTKLLRWFNCQKEDISQSYLKLTFYSL